MSQDTLVHTICYFALQFDHLLRLVGAPGLTDAEKIASLAHWSAVGRRLGVTAIPANWEHAERFMRRYESSPNRFGYTSSGHRCAAALIDQFTSRWLPPPARGMGRLLLLSLQEDHVLRVLDLPRPVRLIQGTIRALVRMALYLRREVLPDRATLLDAESV